MNIVSGSVYLVHNRWGGGGGQPHLVEGCLNAGPHAGVVTRLACMHPQQCLTRAGWRLA